MLWWTYKSFVCSEVKHCAVPEEARALQMSRGRKTCSALSAALVVKRGDLGTWQVFSVVTLSPKACPNLTFGMAPDSKKRKFESLQNLLSKAQGCHKASLGPCGSLGISLTCPVCGESGALAGGQIDAIKSKCQIPGGTACPGKGTRLGWVLLSLSRFLA